jgi:AcrR family transcriptional regulator
MTTPAPPPAAATDAAPRRRNRRGDGERLRVDLLEAAAGLVTETGDASALSLRAIAARVGVAATSVYLHFPDVTAVKIALAQQWFAEFADVRDAAAADIADPATALVVRCQTYARYALAHPGPYRLMFGPGLPPLAAPDADPETPSLRAFEALVAAIRRAQTSDAATADSDPRRLAVLLWTALHGQVTLRMDRPTFPWPELDDMIAELVARLVHLTLPR